MRRFGRAIIIPAILAFSATPVVLTVTAAAPEASPAALHYHSGPLLHYHS